MATGTIQNSIIWDETDSIVISPSGTAKVTYSNIQSGIEGGGNLQSDQRFVDPESGDYRLRSDSPCIDSASIEGANTDLLGNPRPVDVLGVGRDGPGAFDMGCYEFQIKRADMNSDGYLNEFDRLLFQSEWMRDGGAVDFRE